MTSYYWALGTRKHYRINTLYQRCVYKLDFGYRDCLSRYPCPAKTSSSTPVPTHFAVWPSTLASTHCVSCSLPSTWRNSMPMPVAMSVGWCIIPLIYSNFSKCSHLMISRFQRRRLTSWYLFLAETYWPALALVHPAVWPSTLASTRCVSCSRPRTQKHSMPWEGPSLEQVM